MPPTTARPLAREMLAFVSKMPVSQELEWAKDEEFLFHFEAPRLLLVRDMMLKRGLKPEDAFEILDVGYLHGLIPEFIHRFFPKARFTVCDRPESPVFHDATYQEMIRDRSYLELVPCDLKDVAKLKQRFRMILLGEVIEHIDPTVVTACLKDLRGLVQPDGLLVVTTPNGSGFYHACMAMGSGSQEAPVPHGTMGYGHIHLWTPRLLDETAAYAGWKLLYIQFYNGIEGRQFAYLNRHWVNLKGQVFMRLTKLIGQIFPARRGFFVAGYAPAETGGK